MSRAELAEAVCAWLWETTRARYDLDGHYVAKLERGVVRWPTAPYRSGLRHVLGAGSDAELGFREHRRRGSALVIPSIEAVATADDIELSRLTATLDKPWRVERSGIDSVAAVLASARQLEDSTSSTAVLPLAAGLVEIIDSYAAQARSSIRRETLTLASELHCYVGWLSLDTRAGVRAARHFDTAISLAVEAATPDHLAHAASFKGHLALSQDRIDQAVTLSGVSLRHARTFTALRAFDGYQTAHAYALVDDRRNAEHSMRIADRLLDKVPSARLPEWAYWYTLPFLLAHRAIAHEALGQPDEAINDLDIGLSEMPEAHRDTGWGRALRDRLARLVAASGG
jgi:hypothetical protein